MLEECTGCDDGGTGRGSTSHLILVHHDAEILSLAFSNGRKDQRAQEGWC